MSIPATLTVSRVFDDRIDLAIDADGRHQALLLRLSPTAALDLAIALAAACRGDGDASSVTIDHLSPLPADAAEPRAPP